MRSAANRIGRRCLGAGPQTLIGLGAAEPLGGQGVGHQSLLRQPRHYRPENRPNFSISGALRVGRAVVYEDCLMHMQGHPRRPFVMGQRPGPSPSPTPHVGCMRPAFLHTYSSMPCSPPSPPRVQCNLEAWAPPCWLAASHPSPWSPA